MVCTLQPEVGVGRYIQDRGKTSAFRDSHSVCVFEREHWQVRGPSVVGSEPKLFDPGERTDNEFMRPGESQWRFLNRSGRREFGAVRDLLESWFQRYPPEHVAALAGLLRSKDEYQFLSCFWELYLYTTLDSLGLRPRSHPVSCSSCRRSGQSHLGGSVVPDCAG